ncbi:DNA-binding transcriptional regulator, MarR family [Streptomyces zhaozhouensis]|uniref:DNA-binding transcriptional regulator, MarR family n=2 Tax=Streptomyces zhaozhouensis TaxID=1300267 RepID=A0A286DP59_9ACTN|nr:DNA-binding transcriptional regulator, MarR family [Streptomyces zhaozhouensis]
MNDGMQAYLEWADIGEGRRRSEFQSYVRNVAEARYVMRRVLRIVEERAKEHGLEPLSHQALLQTYGAGDGITVSRLAARLDIAAAFASRLVRQLEGQGLVGRSPSESDRRVTIVTATDQGAERLAAIDDDVHRYIAFLQHELADEEKHMALSVFAFYVGLTPDSPVARAIRAVGGG